MSNNEIDFEAAWQIAIGPDGPYNQAWGICAPMGPAMRAPYEEAMRAKLREIVEAARPTRLEAAVDEVLRDCGCREDLGAEGNFDKCWKPAEFVLWGKLIPPEGLGPRCYDHAAAHVGHHALVAGANYALIDLRPLRAALAGSQ